MAKNKNFLNKIIKNVDGSSIKSRESVDISFVEIDNPTPAQIYQQLNSGVCTLFFYKITTGDFRKMKCTLSQDKPIPSKYNRQGVIVVWDLDANEWRSFYPNRVFRLIRDEQTDAE